jgi:hypothetical protein
MGAVGTKVLSGVGTAKGKQLQSDTRKVSSAPRLQLEFSAEAYERLIELKRTTGSRTNAEVIRKALHVLDWVLTKKRENYQLQLVKNDEVRDVELVI